MKNTHLLYCVVLFVGSVIADSPAKNVEVSKRSDSASKLEQDAPNNIDEQLNDNTKSEDVSYRMEKKPNFPQAATSHLWRSVSSLFPIKSKTISVTSHSNGPINGGLNKYHQVHKIISFGDSGGVDIGIPPFPGGLKVDLGAGGVYKQPGGGMSGQNPMNIISSHGILPLTDNGFYKQTRGGMSGQNPMSIISSHGILPLTHSGVYKQVGGGMSGQNPLSIYSSHGIFPLTDSGIYNQAGGGISGQNPMNIISSHGILPLTNSGVYKQAGGGMSGQNPMSIITSHGILPLTDSLKSTSFNMQAPSNVGYHIANWNWYPKIGHPGQLSSAYPYHQASSVWSNGQSNKPMTSGSSSGGGSHIPDWNNWHPDISYPPEFSPLLPYNMPSENNQFLASGSSPGQGFHTTNWNSYHKIGYPGQLSNSYMPALSDLSYGINNKPLMSGSSPDQESYITNWNSYPNIDPRQSSPKNPYNMPAPSDSSNDKNNKPLTSGSGPDQGSNIANWNLYPNIDPRQSSPGDLRKGVNNKRVASGSPPDEGSNTASWDSYSNNDPRQFPNVYPYNIPQLGDLSSGGNNKPLAGESSPGQGSNMANWNLPNNNPSQFSNIYPYDIPGLTDWINGGNNNNNNILTSGSNSWNLYPESGFGGEIAYPYPNNRPINSQGSTQMFNHPCFGYPGQNIGSGTGIGWNMSPFGNLGGSGKLSHNCQCRCGNHHLGM